MGKLATSIMVLSFVLIGFHFAGLIENTPGDVLLNFLLNLPSFETSSLYEEVILLLSLVAGAGIFIGVISKGNIQWALTGGLALIFLAVLWDIVRIYEIVAETNTMLAVFMISPLAISYTITVIEWWKNTD